MNTPKFADGLPPHLWLSDPTILVPRLRCSFGQTLLPRSEAASLQAQLTSRVSLSADSAHWKFDLILLLTRPVTRLPKLRAGGHRQGWNRHAKQLGRSSNPKTACKRQKAKCCPFLPKCWTFAGLLPYNWFLQIVAIKNYFVNTLIFILSCGHENAFFICPSVRRVAGKKIKGEGWDQKQLNYIPLFSFLRYWSSSMK